jgi:hypothetical protein
MASRIENDQPAVLPRDVSPEPAPGTVAGPPAALAARYAEWLEQLPDPRPTLWERIVDAVRRVRYGPPEEPLTEEEMERIMRPREDEDDGLPELVPPDDPERLAWEAHLRSIGVRPAKKWNFPIREPIRKPGAWDKIRHRLGRGW